MDSNIALIVSSSVIIIGWFIAHWFTSKRDHKNKIRETRLEYLINAYRSIGTAAARNENSAEFKNLEAGFHDVQLFGNKEQLMLLNEIFVSHSNTGGADLEPLLNNLRAELRTLLGLNVASTKLKFFRTRS